MKESGDRSQKAEGRSQKAEGRSQKTEVRALMIIAAACALLAPLAIWAQQNAGDEDVILKAMRDELERSRQLRVVGGQDLPYFFAYDFTDSENFRVHASMGSAVEIQHAHLRFPGVEVRVGSYDFDNTGHVYSGLYSGSRYDESWPLDNDYTGLRESFWLATDRAYKAALESMGRKRASINAASAQTDKLPDFSKVEPVVNLAKVAHTKIDQAAWIARVKRLSAIFNEYPEVRSSQMEMQSVDGITYYVTSEGTALRYADKVSWVMARAEGQAPDGMYVRDALSLQALEVAHLPSEAEMQRSVTELAENVRALVKAPPGEAFTGPALFEPQAAAQLLAQLLGDNLRVPRRPLTDPGRNVNFVPSELESRMGGRVLPDWMDVADDPTQSSWNGKPLIGFYSFDLEGVAPQPVKVIEKGLVKAFLTTRQPIRGFPESNGHARLNGAFGAHGAGIGNLFVTAQESAPLADLKQRLIQLCQERGKPYGILVRKLDFPFSAGAGELQGLAQANQQSGGSARPVSPPLLVYRVYPDGREELVRGLRFRGVSTRSLRDVLAASRETALFDFVNNGAPLALMSAGGFLAPSSVVAPGLLFDEIELDLPHDQLTKTPLVPSPSSGQ